MKASPNNIPGKSIRPPNASLKNGHQCPYCKEVFADYKRYTDPKTNRVTLLCPYCKKVLYQN